MLPLLRYTLRRLLSAIPTLFLVVALAFILVHQAPGSPFSDERVLPEAVEDNLRARYHLDESLPEQFVRYVGGLLRGDFGPSYSYPDRSVGDLIAIGLPVSLKLGALALIVSVVLGIAAGIVAALQHNKPLDRLVTGFAMTGISVPVFVVAPVLVLLFAVHLDWLPTSWSGSSGLSRLVLPVIALALPEIASIARLTRANLIDVLGSDFVRTAKAQGLGTAAIVRHHALKPALLPVLSYMGPTIAAVLTGSVVVEEVFGIPGLGQFFVRGALNRDYTLVLGVVVLYAVLIVGLNLIVDLLYSLIDPRIRYR